jgi:hypothetical protein
MRVSISLFAGAALLVSLGLVSCGDEDKGDSDGASGQSGGGQAGETSEGGGTAGEDAGGGGAAGDAGQAGAAGQATQSAFEEVLADFCALSFVSDCESACAETRHHDNANLPQCEEQFAALLSCELALSEDEFDCIDGGIFPSTTTCQTEDNAYVDCSFAH